MDGAGRRRWRGMLCAVTSGQTRFACHWVSQGHSTVPCEPTPRRESSRNQASVSGLPSSLGSRPLEKLDQKGKRPSPFFRTKSRKFLATIFDETQKTYVRKHHLKTKHTMYQVDLSNWLNKSCNNTIFFQKQDNNLSKIIQKIYLFFCWKFLSLSLSTKKGQLHRFYTTRRIILIFIQISLRYFQLTWELFTRFLLYIFGISKDILSLMFFALRVFAKLKFYYQEQSTLI